MDRNTARSTKETKYNERRVQAQFGPAGDASVLHHAIIYPPFPVPPAAAVSVRTK